MLTVMKNDSTQDGTVLYGRNAWSNQESVVPLQRIITNEITMHVEITKTDLKTIVSKNVGDDKFNAIKNALAKDIPGYLAKATYLGWRPVAEGKHIESAYFAYFSRELGCRTILCMRRLADGDVYKPYAIINDHTFAAAEKELRK